MSRYRTISVKMWGDDRFTRLSKPQPNGQSLWVYLLTGPHTTSLPGAFVAGEAALAEALNWPVVSLRKAFTEVLTLGLGKVDRETRLVFLPNAVRHNPPQSPNVVKAWRKSFDELPDCPLKVEIFADTVASLKALGFDEAYTKAFGKVFTYTFSIAIAESEQEQNRTEEPPLVPRDSDASPPVGGGAVDLGSAAYSPDFEIFWSAYPRKTGKGAAWKAWCKLRPSRKLQDRILAAVGEARKSSDWQRDSGRYIPHPTTWLHGQRWDDTVSGTDNSNSFHGFL